MNIECIMNISGAVLDVRMLRAPPRPLIEFVNYKGEIPFTVMYVSWYLINRTFVRALIYLWYKLEI